LVFLIVMKFSLFGLLVLMSIASPAQRLSIQQSPHSVELTTERIIEQIRNQELIYFETVNHDEIAASRGITIAPMREILFEDADMTTTLIECQPTTAIDLPMKILVWEENEEVYIAFMDPNFMKKQYVINQDCEEIIDKMSRMLKRLTVDALRAIRVQD